jgi:adenylate cyclase
MNADGAQSMDHQTTPAILFADVTDSSRLYATYGNNTARKITGDCLDFLGTVVEELHGRVVKTIGDEVMCLFTNTDDAVVAAVQLHSRLREKTKQGFLHNSLSIRVGFQSGPVVEEDGDVFGDAVNLAARMASLSKAHQSLTTRQTIDLVGPALRPLARFVDQSMVKGQSNQMDLYEIVWDLEEATMATDRPHATPMDMEVSLHLYHGDKSWVVDREHPTLSFGRSSQCDVVIEDTRISRLHARFEYNRDRIVLRDVSTNGTYLKLENGEDALIRRDERPVDGNGSLCLGREIDPDSPLVLRFVFKKKEQHIA